MKEKVKKILLNRWAAFIHDLCWVPVVMWLSYWIRFNLGTIPGNFHQGFWNLLLIIIPVQGIAYWVFGLYRGIWRYASLQDLLRVIKAVLLGLGLMVICAFFWFRLHMIPRSVFFLYPILLILGLSAPRIIYRWLNERRLDLRVKTPKRTLIVGAGSHGEQLLRDLSRRPEYLPVALLDDDPDKYGREIHGIRVRGMIDDLQEIITGFSVQLVLVAIPSANRSVIKKIVDLTGKNDVECRTLPSTVELVNKEIDINMIRPVTVEDILGREPVAIDNSAIARFIMSKNVLVTGGGGSIGSELCRQIAYQKPSSLIILEHSEFNLYSIEQEIRRKYPEVQLHCVLGDVKNRDRVNWLFKQFQPQIVFHAAAYKHVPMLEENPAEGVYNNIFGTMTVAETANEYQVDKFVFVSTDKAVNPSNVMGTTKRIAEIYCQNLNEQSDTRFITTRFGNVIGSAGSVVPLFQKQIKEGGPVTVTHRDVKRYFMTISEAVGLILQATIMGDGGEIFVLDMGEQVLIKEMAEQMIRLSGFRPGLDIEIQYVGLRAGEKMHEELFHNRENHKETSHSKLRLAQSRQVEWSWLKDELVALKEAVEAREVKRLRRHLNNIVPEYQYDIVD